MYRNPSLTTDAIIEKGRKIVLIRRGQEPYKGYIAIPGGFVNYGEKVEDAVVREVREETGLKVKLNHLLGIYSEPKRDPRKHVISVVFIASPLSGKLKGADDAASAHLVDIDKIDFKHLAVDHAKILSDYLKWRRAKGTYWSSK